MLRASLAEAAAGLILRGLELRRTYLISQSQANQTRQRVAELEAKMAAVFEQTSAARHAGPKGAKGKGAKGGEGNGKEGEEEEAGGEGGEEDGGATDTEQTIAARTTHHRRPQQLCLIGFVRG